MKLFDKWNLDHFLFALGGAATGCPYPVLSVAARHRLAPVWDRELRNLPGNDRTENPTNGDCLGWAT